MTKKLAQYPYQSHERSHPEHFFNRELSWLKFNVRVLNEAMDPRTPLLERLRFLDIYISNLDEFYMKRVGRLKHQLESAYFILSADGQTAHEQLKEIRRTVSESNQNLATHFYDKIVPALKTEGIELIRWKDLRPTEKSYVIHYFQKNIFPILTPLAVDSGHPFPFLSNMSKSLGVSLARPGEKNKQFARVKIPDKVDDWILVNPESGQSQRFINMVEVIRNNLATLFVGMKIKNVTLFRVVRNADWWMTEEVSSDMMERVEEGLRERKFAPLVRLEHDKNPDPWIIDFLKNELELKDDDLYEMLSEVNHSSLKNIYGLDRPELKHRPFAPKTPREFLDGREEDLNLFNVIAKKDVLVYHPYESFTHSVEKFISSAANDPQVLAIKMTLYRTDHVGQLVDSLIFAAESGKQVACTVELMARFDEERNIRWAQKMEDAGIHVSYGAIGLKTHAKMALVVRRGPQGIQSFAHLGTGNYNAQTSRAYTDLGLFTAHPKICAEVMEVFNFLTGRSLKTDYKELLVSPYNMKDKFLDLVKDEIKHKKAGKRGLIFAQLNSLEDSEIIEALYKASQAGVSVHLIVRGFCGLKPQVKNLSDNIRVYSIIGRLLEHSRFFYFSAGERDALDGKFFIGSADWMSRNLHHRVEVAVPILSKHTKRKLWGIFNTLIEDQRQLWELKGNGEYVQRTPRKKEEMLGAQEKFIDLAQDYFIPLLS